MNAANILLAWLFMSSAPAFGGEPTPQTITMDEFGTVLISNAQAQLGYKGSEADTKIDQKIKEYNARACANFFAIDLVEYVFVDGVKALPVETIKRKLGQLDLASTERDLQKSCGQIRTTGKARTIISASIATLESQPKIKALVDQVAKELNQSNKGLQSKFGREIDLVGIVPGASKKADVDRAAHSKHSFCDQFCLEIGGYDLACDAEYDESETLSTLTCWFGGKYSNGGNAEVFNALKPGLAAKLGKPVMDRKFQARNMLGIVFEGEDIRWRDENGNTLELQSPVKRIDQGALAIKSAARNVQQRLEDEKKGRERKF